MKKTKKRKKEISLLSICLLIFFMLLATKIWSSVNFPETPAGKRVKEIVALINLGDDKKAEQYVNDNYALNFRDAFPMDQHVSIFTMVHKMFGELKLYEIKSSSDYSLNCRLRSLSGKSTLEINLVVEENKPHMITRMGIRPVNVQAPSKKGNEINIEKEKNAIKKVIQDSLVDGYLNDYNTQEMEKGIHSEFRNLELRNNKLSKRDFEDLLAYIKRVKPHRPNGRRVKVTVKFLMVDVIGNIGCAKVEFYDGPNLHGTDFITLIKFENGWKLIGTLAYEHR